MRERGASCRLERASLFVIIVISFLHLFEHDCSLLGPLLLIQHGIHFANASRLQSKTVEGGRKRTTHPRESARQPLASAASCVPSIPCACARVGAYPCPLDEHVLDVETRCGRAAHHRDGHEESPHPRALEAGELGRSERRIVLGVVLHRGEWSGGEEGWVECGRVCARVVEEEWICACGAGGKTANGENQNHLRSDSLPCAPSMAQTITSNKNERER